MGVAPSLLTLTIKCPQSSFKSIQRKHGDQRTYTSWRWWCWHTASSETRHPASENTTDTFINLPASTEESIDQLVAKMPKKFWQKTALFIISYTDILFTVWRGSLCRLSRKTSPAGCKTSGTYSPKWRLKIASFLQQTVHNPKTLHSVSYVTKKIT